MDDERNNEQGGGEPQAEGTITYGRNNLGDLYIDGTLVERGQGIGHEESLEPPAADPGELAELRRRNAELESQFERGEPFLRLADKPVLRDILNEFIERGEVEPNLPPPPSSRDVLEFNLRRDDPDFPVVQGIMREWASTLPQHEADVLNNNHAAFVREYDRIKAEGRLPKSRPPVLPSAYPNVPMDRRTLETILRSKEVRNARVESPGGAVQDANPVVEESQAAEKEYYRTRERQRRAHAEGRPVDRERADRDLVEKWFAASEPKKPARGTNW